jgi:hypothetical protein
VLPALLSGLVFALGLGVAEMTLPARVLGFLRLEDPALAFVMAGAVATTLVGFALLRRRGRPLLAPRFELPTRRDVDAPLLVGAALFGVGWGLTGLCPGPALTDLVTLDPGLVLFCAAMLAGLWAAARLRGPD